MQHKHTRREILLGLLAAPATSAAAAAPATPVAIARCASYGEDQAALLASLFDKLGGLGRLVANKTVVIKLNLTGSPALRFQGRPLGTTHYTHPAQALALAHLLGKAGARRIRFVESFWATNAPLEECMLDAGWNVRQLKNAAPNVEFENTNFRGKAKTYARFKVPGGGMIFSAYDLNRAYEETDVVVSLAKLKEHATCGVTLAAKNMFGITPASIYGDDAGIDEPNENPTKGRVDVCHLGKRQPAKAAAPELDPKSSRDPGYRMPRITAELVAARPVDISIVDGIETIAGGEGPWIQKIRRIQPGVVIAGTNPICTDAVATAVMGFNPRDAKGSGAFRDCDNTLLLAEQLGVGSADLRRIEVRGEPVEKVMFPFRS
jgi:uncharacterized protein (DUF362 family)